MTEDELKLKAWRNAVIVTDYDANKFRKDACGAWIMWDKYNVTDSVFGWQIDHIYPQSKLKERGFSQDAIDNPANIRAMQHQNNQSKGADYPDYMAVVTSQDNRNVQQRTSLSINAKKQAELKQLYNL
jgi:hypothetical protein